MDFKLIGHNSSDLDKNSLNSERIQETYQMVLDTLFSAQLDDTVGDTKFILIENEEALNRVENTDEIDIVNLADLLHSLFNESNITIPSNVVKDITIICRVIFNHLTGFDDDIALEDMFLYKEFQQILETIGKKIFFNNVNSSKIMVIGKEVDDEAAYSTYVLEMFEPVTE